MFFAPPEVKSLSRYSEFGSYLQFKHFMLMVGLAIFLHISFITIYSLMPHEEVTKIPVRVLNIKLDGGDNESFNPQPITPNLQPQINQIGVPVPAVAATPEPPPLPANKISHHPEKSIVSILQGDDGKTNKKSDKLSEINSEMVILKPKRYVRANDNDNKNKGNGSGIKGNRTGDEIVRSYEQEISLWIKQHKIYPESLRNQGLQGRAVVKIRINRAGEILYSAVDTSSGNSAIDEAALAMVKKSNPLPSVPDDYPEANELEFLIPASFTLQ